MSRELINGQIMTKYDELFRIEEEARKKHSSTKDEIREKYDTQISNLDNKLYSEKVKEITFFNESLANDLTKLKNQKEREFLMKIKAINKEEQIKKKVILKEIKLLEKEMMDIENMEVKD